MIINNEQREIFQHRINIDWEKNGSNFFWSRKNKTKKVLSIIIQINYWICLFHFFFVWWISFISYRYFALVFCFFITRDDWMIDWMNEWMNDDELWMKQKKDKLLFVWKQTNKRKKNPTMSSWWFKLND